MSRTILALVLPLLAQSPIAGQTRPPTFVTLDVRVTDRSGVPLQDAHLTVEGPSSRAADTGADGHAIVRNMTAGPYRVRVECEGFIPLEKEVALRAGAAPPIEVALSKAPAPPPTPTPAPTPAPTPPPAAAPTVAPGEPRVLSIPDLAEKALSGRDPVKEAFIGCSGLGSARLIQVRDSLAAHTHADADEMLYVVAGAAVLNLAGKDQNIGTGWFAIVPRGMQHSLTRQGRNPVFVLSSLSGEPCARGGVGSGR